MIKVLIVEDSPVIQEFITHILNSDPGIKVIGVAGSGEEALDNLKSQTDNNLPDVITMDIVMPGMDGLQTIRSIMETMPRPIIVVSSHVNGAEKDKSFDALNAGAVTVIETPPGIDHPEYKKKAAELIEKIKLLAGIKVVTRRSKYYEDKITEYPAIKNLVCNDIKLVAIGASTGGPVAIQEILSRLTVDFPMPVLIIQHISEGFSRAYVKWLNHETVLHVKIAEQNEKLFPGNVYVAPENYQMGVVSCNQIILTHDECENGVSPSVSYLFRSISDVCAKQSIGVLLSGMGNDGSKELKLLRDRGAFTIAQDEASSIVFGMPKKSIEIGGAQFILSPEKIAHKLISLANESREYVL